MNSRIKNDLLWELFNDEGVETTTSEDQIRTERELFKPLENFWSYHSLDPDSPKLTKTKHLQYLRKSLSLLPSGYACLDCSRPWLCYWTLHPLHLLGEVFSSEVVRNVSDFLSRCQNPDGGFGGGPGQVSHLAPTYAAICALCILGDDVAFKVIDRTALVNFLKRMKLPNGAFTMHEGGEIDIRGVYCALSVARLTNVYSDALFDNTAEWVASCQTYEGGFGAVPELEAHGGLTFCGLASLILLNRTHLCDAQALLRWCAYRQMRFEGGFNGRPNKLVDGCYSFWVGGCFPLLQSLLAESEPSVFDDDSWLFHQEGLQEYILICCQHPDGGLVDKPIKDRDLYHTAYVLSGLSIAQHSKEANVLGDAENLIKATHPLYNIGKEMVVVAADYFSRLPVPLPS